MTTSVVSTPVVETLSTSTLKQRLLQLAAQTDRGKLQDPLIASEDTPLYQAERRMAVGLMEQLAQAQRAKGGVDTSLLEGQWELVYSTAQLFRSSPFFMAIAEAYQDEDKSELFFKLHELQTSSWGASTIGRVAQNISLSDATLVSEFDTVLLPLTVIPLLGFWKLFPTFGGRIISIADKLKVVEGPVGVTLEMELAKTSFKRVSGLGMMPGLGPLLEGKEFPTRSVWEALPWNKGPPSCSLRVKYLDADMRVMEDTNGALFVYARPLLTQPEA